jgi:hypothetical protein
MCAFADQGESPPRSLDEVLARMEVLGAVADECEAVRRSVGVFRASDPLACPREYGWTPDWRDCPALWRLALGRNDVSDVMMYTHVMNRSGVGMGRSYRTIG